VQELFGFEQLLVLLVGFAIGMNAFWSKELVAKKINRRRQRRDDS
jgi:hypothetical protein